MKRGTKLFLLAGCCWIVVLDAPAAIAALTAGWRGPYDRRAVEVRSASSLTPSAPLLVAQGPEPAHVPAHRRGRLDLARR